MLNVLVGVFTFLAMLLFALWALRGSGRSMEQRIRALAMARQRGDGLSAVPPDVDAKSPAH